MVIRAKFILLLVSSVLILCQCMIWIGDERRITPLEVNVQMQTKGPDLTKGSEDDGRTTATAPLLKSMASHGFDWGDVDLTRSGTCGWHKCFFPSLSNTSVGYLVANYRRYSEMKQGADLAKTIESRFGSKHFHLDLVTVNVTRSFVKKLQSLVDQPARRVKGLPNGLVYKDMDTQVAVETVVRAPEPNLFFAAIRASATVMVKQLADFRPLIPDRDAFREQLQAEHERLTRVLKVHPSMACDFQAMIDTMGNLYHIDLDEFGIGDKKHHRVNLYRRKVLESLQDVTLNLTVAGVEVTRRLRVP